MLIPTLAQSAPRTSVRLDIQFPKPGSEYRPSRCGSFIAGRATTLSEDRLAVALVIDTSYSTLETTEQDLDGDGEIGVPETRRVGQAFHETLSDLDDSVLAAEIGAARKILQRLNPEQTRVSLVRFAGPSAGGRERRGDHPERRPAETLLPPTHDFASIENALNALIARRPYGGTHMAAGIREAMGGLQLADSEDDGDHAERIVLFTDGFPTLPFGPAQEAANVRATIDQAKLAAENATTIDVFAVGPEALGRPLAAFAVTRETGGQLLPVRDPADLLMAAAQFSLVGLRSLQVRNTTSGAPASILHLHADGYWFGLIPLAPGSNEIEVRVEGNDGESAQRSFMIVSNEDAAAAAIPPQWVDERNSLLALCLRKLREARFALEAERVERTRKELLLRMEAERRRAASRAEAQRKELEIDVDSERMGR